MSFRSSGLLPDLRHSARGLTKRPGFTLAVVATIALGVGANAAIFSVVDAALLRPLPYVEPDRLVHLWSWKETGEGSRMEASYPDFLDIRERAKTLEGVAGYHTNRATLATGDVALVLPAAKVTANFFDVLGVNPLAGRRFEEGEDAADAPPVAMITHDLWQRVFSAEQSVVGRTVQIDGVTFTIVGVLPPEFQFAASQSAELWIPLDRTAAFRERRGTHWLKPVARLRDGATIESARRELAAIMQDLAREHPATNTAKSIQLAPLRDELMGVVRPLVLILYGAVAFVLLVACGNVANLLLMRGASRERELGIRAALGAGRARITRQLLTESGMLTIAGGILGIVVAHFAIRALVAAIPFEQARAFPYLRDAGINAAVIGYTLLVTVIAGLVSGLVPALKASRGDLANMLRPSGGSSGGSQRRLRDGLVIAELALTVVLVTGAAMFAKSLAGLLSVDTGIRAEGVMTMMLPLPRREYRDDEVQRQFYQRLEDRVAALPGVTSVGFTSKLPLEWGNSTSYAVVGTATPEPGQFPSASFRVVNPEYFRTMGIPFLSGGTFATAAGDSAGVVIINRTLARNAFGDRDAVGQQLSLGRSTVTVVGVVGDVTIGKLEDEIPATMYFSWHQSMDNSLRLAVRTNGDPYTLVQPIRSIIQEIDPGVGIYQVYAMDDFVGQSQSVFLRRYPLILVGSFAVVALLLALVGTYGVISYSVTQRLRELGIRIALGAEAASIRWLVLRHAGVLALAGITIGVLLTVALSRFASSLLYGVEPTDPLIFGSVAAILGVMALAAAMIPAHRATRTDPLIALKAE